MSPDAPGLVRYDGFHPSPPEAALPPELDDQLDIGKYISGLRRRWLLIATCFLITASYALIQYSLTTKVYKASAVIQIERKRLSLFALGQAGWMEDWWNFEYYPTQYRLLRSRVMAERVVKHLRLWEHPAFSGGEAQLLPSGEPAEVTETSRAQLARLAGQIQGGLEVRPIEETQLVELTFHSPWPELTAQVANAFGQVFIEWGVESRTETVGQASDFLTEQIETLRGEIEDHQSKLNAYTSSGDFAIDPAGEALLERRQTLEGQYNSVVGDRIRKEAAYRQIINQTPEAVANSSSRDKVGELKSELFLLDSEYKTGLETYTAEWPSMVKLENEIKDKRDQLELLIQEAYTETKNTAFTEFQQAKREESSLEEELQRLAADARLQNSAALEYTNRVTYIDTRKELLGDLVKRQSETEVQSRLQSTSESNVRIVDLASVPGSPFRPSLRRGLTSALLIGLFLGVGGIVLLEFMDRTIKTPEELEAITGYPTLTVIPDISKGRAAGRRYRYGKGGYGYGYGYGYGGADQEGSGGRRKGGDDQGVSIELLPHTDPRLAICEAYRALRTALLLSSTGELKTVALTSAEPGEGKTATTCNLATVLAQLGRRVIVIDADLRRPRMHKIFEIPNRLGLVNYLTGQHTLEEIIYATEVDKLYICPSGPIPPNPSELLASERMLDLLALMRSRFDFVLIDTPPALPVADAVILGGHTDGLVICVRAGSLQREDAKACRDRLRYADLKVFGTVLNRHSESSGGYSKRYRYYGAYEESEPETETHSAA